MSDAIFPSVDSGVSRRKDAVRRHGESRRNNHHSYFTMCVILSYDSSSRFLPRSKTWIFSNVERQHWPTPRLRGYSSRIGDGYPRFSAAEGEYTE